MLGKRKREVAVARRQSTDNEEEAERVKTANSPADDQAVFRRHFESLFEPLPKSRAATLSSGEDEEASEISDELSDQESEWEGLSEAGFASEAPNDTVEVVEHRSDTVMAEDIDSQRQQYKTFMVRFYASISTVQFLVDLFIRVRDLRKRLRE